MIETLDLFSGIGGFSRGLESTGHFRTVGFCEIEPFCREVLAHHWPGVPVHDDVRTLTAESLGGLRPDAIVGGFPCQDISVAGKGVGIEGSRSGLWGEFARLVVELRPRWVIAENVGALRTRGIDRVCSDLEAEGYAVWPLVVGAWAVGAPHRRDRVWIVAHRDSALREQPRRGSGEGGSGEAESRGSGQALADADDGRGGQNLMPSQLRANGALQSPRGPRAFSQSSEGVEVSRQLSDPEGERWSEQGHGGDAGSRAGRDGPRWPARPGEPQHEWEEPRLAYGTASRRGAGRPETDRTARDNARGPEPERLGRSGHSQLPVGSTAHGLRERLVPDLAALSGLTEDFVSAWWERNRFKVERAHNREALKAYGNSVVPAVVAVIGRAIAEVDNAEF